MLFQGFYSKSDAALENKDLDGHLAYHDPDFVLVQQNGDETDLGDIRYQISNWLDIARSVHAATSVVSANVKGVNSTVMVKSVLTMVIIDPESKARGVLVDRKVTKDTWSHHSDGWMLMRSQIVSESTTNNGHKVYDKNNPFAPAPSAQDGDDTPDTATETPQTNASPGSSD